MDGHETEHEAQEKSGLFHDRLPANDEHGRHETPCRDGGQ
jgi:hypothetical protein